MSIIPMGYTDFTDFLNASEFYLQEKFGEDIKIDFDTPDINEEFKKFGYEIKQNEEGTEFDLQPIAKDSK